MTPQNLIKRTVFISPLITTEPMKSVKSLEKQLNTNKTRSQTSTPSKQGMKNKIKNKKPSDALQKAALYRYHGHKQERPSPPRHPDTTRTHIKPHIRAKHPIVQSCESGQGNRRPFSSFIHSTRPSAYRKATFRQKRSYFSGSDTSTSSPGTFDIN